jgi:TorA maturation chaperone TorD
VALIDELTAEDRARTFDLLATVFGSAPTEESSSALCNLAQALGLCCPDGLALADIRREFMDLLVVPNARYVAPYESAYRDSRLILTPDGHTRRRAGLLMGESTLAVRQAFIEAGVLPERDLPDHIANELRLVSHLWHVEACGDPEQALAAARQRGHFVVQHLLCWIGDLRDTIAQNSVTGLYCAATEAAEVLLSAESALAEARGEIDRQEECPQPR